MNVGVKNAFEQTKFKHMKSAVSTVYLSLLLIIISSFTIPVPINRAVSVQTGVASYYADFHQGKKTANGEIYQHEKLTAAHRSLPFGTEVTVTNLSNGKSVTVRINDRGPFVKGRLIDLSKKAAKEIGLIKAGIAKVKIEYEAGAAASSR